MSQKIAKEDIVHENEVGQQVVIVPAGQPIPDDLEARIAASVPVRQKAVEPVEDKSRKRAKKK